MRRTASALRFWAAALVFAALLFSGGTAAQEGGAGRWTRPAPISYAPFEVEVLVGGRPLEELRARGRRYVEAAEGAEYELLVRNPSPYRVAVAVSVDGLNTIDARRTSSWEASKWVIEPYRSIRLSGWQMSSRHARRFYFTTERDSYAARLGRASDLGLITAVFYRELSPRPYPITPAPIYRDERAPRERSETEGRSGSQPPAMSRPKRGAIAEAPRPDDEHAATGIGRPVDHRVSWVSMDLERRPAAEVTIRYEYRDALYRLGVLPRPRPDDDTLRRRERARGFSPEPGYCPEP